MEANGSADILPTSGGVTAAVEHADSSLGSQANHQEPSDMGAELAHEDLRLKQGEGCSTDDAVHVPLTSDQPLAIDRDDPNKCTQEPLSEAGEVKTAELCPPIATDQHATESLADLNQGAATLPDQALATDAPEFQRSATPFFTPNELNGAPPPSSDDPISGESAVPNEGTPNDSSHTGTSPPVKSQDVLDAAAVAEAAAPVPSGTAAVTSVALGFRHTLVALADGSLCCFGLNGRGQCDVPPDLGPIVSVAAGHFHSCAVRANGSLACWGDNSFGQCSVPEDLGQVVSAAASYSHTCVIDAAGDLHCFGDNVFGQCDIPEDIETVQSVAAGFKHTCVLQSDGQLECFGDNEHGQCEVPEGLGKVKALAAGDFHTCALKEDGSVVCFGLNSHGQCSMPEVVGDEPFVAVAAGAHHTCLVRADSTILCFGAKGHGQCDLPEGLTATEVVVREEVIEDDSSSATSAMSPTSEYSKELEGSDLFSMQDDSTSVDRSPRRSKYGRRGTRPPEAQDETATPADEKEPTTPPSKKKGKRADASSQEPSSPTVTEIEEPVSPLSTSAIEEAGPEQSTPVKSSKKKKKKKADAKGGDPLSPTSTENGDLFGPDLDAPPPPPPPPALAAGRFHTAVWHMDGALFLFGDDSGNQCELPDMLHPKRYVAPPPAEEIPPVAPPPAEETPASADQQII